MVTEPDCDPATSVATSGCDVEHTGGNYAVFQDHSTGVLAGGTTVYLPGMDGIPVCGKRTSSKDRTWVFKLVTGSDLCWLRTLVHFFCGVKS